MYDLLEALRADTEKNNARMAMFEEMWDELDTVDEEDHTTMDLVFSKWDWNLRTLEHKDTFGGVWGVEL